MYITSPGVLAAFSKQKKCEMRSRWRKRTTATATTSKETDRNKCIVPLVVMIHSHYSHVYISQWPPLYGCMERGRYQWAMTALFHPTITYCFNDNQLKMVFIAMFARLRSSVCFCSVHTEHVGRNERMKGIKTQDKSHSPHTWKLETNERRSEAKKRTNDKDHRQQSTIHEAAWKNSKNTIYCMNRKLGCTLRFHMKITIIINRS